MNTYDMSQIIKMWEHMEITVDQAIGQLMLHVQHLTQRVTALERRLEGLDRPVAGSSSQSSELL
ncbi:MAG: hypothetical protein R3C14_07000 [Caldilineaceae bacterium]